MFATDTEPAAIVVRPPALTTAIAGQTIRLTCVAYGYPIPSVTWNKDSVALTDKVVDETVNVSETTFMVSVLQLCNLTSADAGEYTCTAVNDVSGSAVASDRANFFLSVSQPVTGEGNITVHLFHFGCMHVCCSDILQDHYSMFVLKGCLCTCMCTWSLPCLMFSVR